MIICLNNRKLNFTSEYQFVYPIPEGSELIVAALFRDGVIRENQFACWLINLIINKLTK